MVPQSIAALSTRGSQLASTIGVGVIAFPIRFTSLKASSIPSASRHDSLQVSPPFRSYAMRTPIMYGTMKAACVRSQLSMSGCTTDLIPAEVKTSASPRSVTVVICPTVTIVEVSFPSSSDAMIAGKPKVKRSAPTASRKRASGSKVLNMNITWRARLSFSAGSTASTCCASTVTSTSSNSAEGSSAPATCTSARSPALFTIAFCACSCSSRCPRAITVTS